MQEVSSYNHELINRISPIVEKLFKANSLYLVKLKKQEMIEMLANLFGQLSSEEMRAIKDNDLTLRIDKILVLEAVSGTLNDLTPEQIQMYDEAVKRK
jgi:predicted CopG family antitoxin